MAYIDDFDLELEMSLLELEEENYGEIINEEAVIQKNGFSIHIDPDRGRSLGEQAGYFKWANNESFDKADKIARISFCFARYDDHYKDTKQYRLKPIEKDRVIKEFSKPLSNSAFHKLPEELHDIVSTMWQYSIYVMNKHCDISLEDMLKYTDLNIELPDNLKTKMIRLTYPMPNYSIL